MDYIYLQYKTWRNILTVMQSEQFHIPTTTVVSYMLVKVRATSLSWTYIWKTSKFISLVTHYWPPSEHIYEGEVIHMHTYTHKPTHMCTVTEITHNKRPLSPLTHSLQRVIYLLIKHTVWEEFMSFSGQRSMGQLDLQN